MVVRISWERAFAGPMTKPLPFTEARVRRTIAAARKEGVAVNAVSVHPDGTVTVYQGIAASGAPAQDAAKSKWLDVEA
jgi:hypothetical protein